LAKTCPKYLKWETKTNVTTGAALPENNETSADLTTANGGKFT